MKVNQQALVDAAQQFLDSAEESADVDVLYFQDIFREALGTANQFEHRDTVRKNKVTEQDVEEAIKFVDFIVLADMRTTICTITLYNDFTVRGESSCVDIANFDKELGQKLSYESAKRAVWPVLGAILAEELYQSGKDDEAPELVEESELTRAARQYLEVLAAQKAAKEARHEADRVVDVGNTAVRLKGECLREKLPLGTSVTLGDTTIVNVDNAGLRTVLSIR